MAFSDYIVYVDESGDHGLENVDPNYPLFVLAFCIFKKGDYHGACSPAIQEFKFKYFGHDMVVLHEREIRQASGAFRILVNSGTRQEFMAGLDGLVDDANFTLIASAIRKLDLQKTYIHPANPYAIALVFCLERLQQFLKAKRNREKDVHVVFESRGKKEDEELELTFRRICDGDNYAGEKMPFEPIFAPKAANCGGLQLADLVARPVGRHILDPGQPNRAYSIIEKKFRRSSGGKITGWGLKVFP